MVIFPLVELAPATAIVPLEQAPAASGLPPMAAETCVIKPLVGQLVPLDRQMAVPLSVVAAGSLPVLREEKSKPLVQVAVQM